MSDQDETSLWDELGISLDSVMPDVPDDRWDQLVSVATDPNTPPVDEDLLPTDTDSSPTSDEDPSDMEIDMGDDDETASTRDDDDLQTDRDDSTTITSDENPSDMEIDMGDDDETASTRDDTARDLDDDLDNASDLLPTGHQDSPSDQDFETDWSNPSSAGIGDHISNSGTDDNTW